MYRKFCRDTYKEAVALNTNIDAELKDALNTHERIPSFIDNLAASIVQVQDRRIKQGKPKFEDRHIKDVIYDMVDVFISSIKMEAQKRNESDLARMAREAAIQHAKDLDLAAAGQMVGDFEELKGSVNAS